MVLLFSHIVIGSTAAGMRHLGSGGLWIGGVNGFLVAVVVWFWAIGLHRIAGDHARLSMR